MYDSFEIPILETEMNNCAFTGRLTHDPEMTTFPSGKKVARFSIAVDRRYQDSAGVWQSDPSYLDFELWDKGAEVLCQRYKKGDFILITDSSIKTDRWKDKTTGQERSKLMFRCNHFEPLPKLNPSTQEHPEDKGENAEGTSAPVEAPAKKTSTRKAAPAPAQAQAAPVGGPSGDEGDDIPF